eukprot:406792-Rhodomonas_salina.1
MCERGGIIVATPTGVRRSMAGVAHVCSTSVGHGVPSSIAQQHSTFEPSSIGVVGEDLMLVHVVQ